MGRAQRAERKKAEALIGAVLSNDLSALKSILDSGADANLKDDHGATALMYAAAHRSRLEAVNLLHDSGADVNFREAQGLFTFPGRTALMFAGTHGREKVVKLSLSRGADVNAQDSDGETALMKAAFNGHIKIVELLLSAKANPTLTNNDGETVLMLAEQIGQIRVVESLEGDVHIVSDDALKQ